MTTAPLKAKKLKFYKIISDKIQKTQFYALFLAQDWSHTTFKASNYNYSAVNNDEKQGRQFYLVIFLRVRRVTQQLPTFFRQ